MLPSTTIPLDFLGPDLAALLGTVGWLAIVPVLVALGVLIVGILTEDRLLAAVRRMPKPGPAPGSAARRAPRPERSAA
jgi:hypothetical protein